MPAIATNTPANTAVNALNRNSREQEKALSKLSSGSRIVRASDDAAGLAVGSKLKADISTLAAAANNAVQARSVLQTADGALARVADMLQRQKALSAQAVSGSVDDTSRGYMDQEYQALKNEIISIGTNTKFNGTALLTNAYTGGVATFQVGTAVADVIIADLNTVVVSAAALTSQGNAIGTAANATTAAGNLDTDIGKLAGYRATVGSLISRFEFRGDVIASSMENLESAKSSIMDVDLASEQTNLVSKQVLTEAAIAALSQANQMKSSLLSLVR